MTAVRLIGLAVLVALALEVISWVLLLLSARLGRPIPNRKKFLAQQSAALERLANNRSPRAQIHPVLGWQYGSNLASATDNLNSIGLRALREYSDQPPPGVARIATFGDSFTYCNEVGDKESWPHQIEAGWNAEVLNYGVGGYGTDQALLRFRDEGARLNPEIVIIGFTSLMAPRVVSRYRRFQDPNDGPWFKPRFILENNQLRFLAAPVASREDADRLLADPAAVAAFGTHDFWYNPAIFEHRLYPLSAAYRFLASVPRAFRYRYVHRDRIFDKGELNPESEAFALLKAIFCDFQAIAHERGIKPIVLMLPARSDVDLIVRGGTPSYEPLREQIDTSGLQVIDAARAFARTTMPVAELFSRGGHYSEKGNALVAAEVASTLQLERQQYPLGAANRTLPDIVTNVSAQTT
jgi:hypothetical protein